MSDYTKIELNGRVYYWEGVKETDLRDADVVIAEHRRQIKEIKEVTDERKKELKAEIERLRSELEALTRETRDLLGAKREAAKAARKRKAGYRETLQGSRRRAAAFEKIVRALEKKDVLDAVSADVEKQRIVVTGRGGKASYSFPYWSSEEVEP
jgi:DNA repair exonuclease SbcCD ATPase subunit